MHCVFSEAYDSSELEPGPFQKITVNSSASVAVAMSTKATSLSENQKVSGLAAASDIMIVFYSSWFEH